MPNLFDDAMIREIYRRGVRDAYEQMCAHLSSMRCREMEDWMTELDLWTDGNPPRARTTEAN